jgi:hypothetical protein
MTDSRINGKWVSVHSYGKIFVEGKDIKLKMWEGSSTRHSNHSGTEQKDVNKKIQKLIKEIGNFSVGRSPTRWLWFKKFFLQIYYRQY